MLTLQILQKQYYIISYTATGCSYTSWYKADMDSIPERQDKASTGCVV